MYSLIEEYAYSSMLEVNVNDLCGYRIAIDCPTYIYRFLRSVGDDWASQFISFLCTLKKNKINMLCIFDGKNAPKEKNEERAKRKNQMNRTKTRIEKLENIEDSIIRNGDENIKDEVINELRSLLIKSTADNVNFSYRDDIMRAIKLDLFKLRKQILVMNNDIIDTAVGILDILGIPNIIADGEAEKLCVKLAVDGRVDAVLSEDTDVLAYGAPIMFSLRRHRLCEEKLYCIVLEELLGELELNSKEFIDLCIMLSCDYNKRAKGFPYDSNKKTYINSIKKKTTPVNLGIKHSYKMILKHKNIDDMLELIDNPETLKHNECREIFNITKYNPKIEDIVFNGNVDYELLEEFMNDNDISFSINYISDIFRKGKINFI